MTFYFYLHTQCFVFHHKKYIVIRKMYVCNCVFLVTVMGAEVEAVHLENIFFHCKVNDK